jgi:hypothetical protein
MEGVGKTTKKLGVIGVPPISMKSGDFGGHLSAYQLLRKNCFMESDTVRLKHV